MNRDGAAGGIHPYLQGGEVILGGIGGFHGYEVGGVAGDVHLVFPIRQPSLDHFLPELCADVAFRVRQIIGRRLLTGELIFWLRGLYGHGGWILPGWRQVVHGFRRSKGQRGHPGPCIRRGDGFGLGLVCDKGHGDRGDKLGCRFQSVPIIHGGGGASGRFTSLGGQCASPPQLHHLLTVSLHHLLQILFGKGIGVHRASRLSYECSIYMRCRQET